MMLLLLLFALTSFAAVAAKYLIDTGLLRGYPDADYLTPQEAALRPVYDGLDIKEKAVYSALYRGISIMFRIMFKAAPSPVANPIAFESLNARHMEPRNPVSAPNTTEIRSGGTYCHAP